MPVHAARACRSGASSGHAGSQGGPQATLATGAASLHRPPARLQELQDLASIPSAEAIGASRTASALRQRRLSIRLCRASYDLLTHFLQSPRQLVILSIVNEHVKFEASLGGSASKSPARAVALAGPISG